MIIHYLSSFLWQFPLLYQEGVQNVLFSWRRIVSWMFNGFYSATIIFFCCSKALEHQAFNGDGKTVGRDILGATMYTCIVWAVNLQMALAISYFTIIQHVLIWGSIAVWYLFLLAYGAISPQKSTIVYKILVEALGPAPSYWLVTLFVVLSTLMPYFLYSAIQMRFFPMYHQRIQRIKNEGQSNDPEYLEMVQQRQPSVGFSARYNRLSDKNQNQSRH